MSLGSGHGTVGMGGILRKTGLRKKRRGQGHRLKKSHIYWAEGRGCIYEGKSEGQEVDKEGAASWKA